MEELGRIGDDADQAVSDGKLTPELVSTLARSRSDIHFPKPRVVTKAVRAPRRVSRALVPRVVPMRSVIGGMG
mgnify:CR=1 FL=1